MRRKVNPLDLPPEALLTVRQAAAICGVSEKNLRDQISNGVLKVMYWGKSNEPRIPRWSLRVWQEGELGKPEDSILRMLQGPARPRRVAVR